MKIDYSYHFSDFADNLSLLEATHHHTNKSYQMEVRINDEQLIRTNSPKMPSLVADLVDLAAAIYIADWVSPRNQHIAYNIHLNLPLRHPDIFSSVPVLTCLQDLLKWYTGDNWHFELKSRFKYARLAESNNKLDLSDTFNSIEVALWSGGLDSLAGLCSRLAEKTSEQFTLFGSGSNNFIHGKQEQIAEGVKQYFPHRIRLLQVPIQIHYLSDKPNTNDLFRARGFTFNLLGSVCAYLEGQQVLHIYENGFGAINLPYRLSEIGLSHTRSVHPISLLKMSDFVTQLLGVPFVCYNPFLFSTKAQMCENLPKIRATSLAFETVSCDGRYRQVDQPSQCSYCSSCLLRRLAFAAAEIEDRTEYLVTHGGKPSDSFYERYFRAMQSQVKILRSILNSDNPWQGILQRYPDLYMLVSILAEQERIEPQIIQQKLLQLYKKHTEEWTYLKEDVFEQKVRNRKVDGKQLQLM